MRAALSHSLSRGEGQNVSLDARVVTRGGGALCAERMGDVLEALLAAHEKTLPRPFPALTTFGFAGHWGDCCC